MLMGALHYIITIIIIITHFITLVNNKSFQSSSLFHCLQQSIKNRIELN